MQNFVNRIIQMIHFYLLLGRLLFVFVTKSKMHAFLHNLKKYRRWLGFFRTRGTIIDILTCLFPNLHEQTHPSTVHNVTLLAPLLLTSYSSAASARLAHPPMFLFPIVDVDTSVGRCVSRANTRASAPKTHMHVCSKWNSLSPPGGGKPTKQGSLDFPAAVVVSPPNRKCIGREKYFVP